MRNQPPAGNIRSFTDTEFTRIYTEYKTYIENYLKGLLHSEQAAEDITQDIFLSIYEKNNIIICDNPKLEKSYLLTIAKNRARDYIRRKTREEIRYKKIYFEEVELNDSFFQDIENSYIDGEVLNTLFDTMNQLDSREKKVLIEKIVNNLNDVRVIRKTRVTHYTLKKIEKKFAAMVRERCQGYFT